MNKKFLIAVCVFLCFQKASYATNWQELQTLNNNKAYIDLDSVVINIPRLYYNVKYEKEHNYYIFNFVSNCDTRMTRIISVRKFDSNGNFIADNDTGTFYIAGACGESQQEKEARARVVEISPNSINEAAYNKVCAIIKANNEKLALMKTILVPVKLKKDTFSEFLWGNCVVINMQLKNTQNKTIEAFEGNIEVYDTLNNKLASLNVQGGKIAKQSAHNFSYSWQRWNDKNNRMSEIYNNSNKNLIFVFYPTRIIFDDNTSL